jgi:hypothetical protein
MYILIILLIMMTPIIMAPMTLLVVVAWWVVTFCEPGISNIGITMVVTVGSGIMFWWIYKKFYNGVY